jgi:integrase
VIRQRTAEGARTLRQLPDPGTLKGKRGRFILALLLGCRLRLRELTELTFDHVQRREDHGATIQRIGKAVQVRTIPVSSRVKEPFMIVWQPPVSGRDSVPSGHALVHTTEKYLACKQRLREAVSDKIGFEPCP